MDADGRMDQAARQAVSSHTPRPRLPARDIAWRRGLLRSAGLPDDLSRAVAASHEHDVNGLIGLLERRCPPATALRITVRDDRTGVA